jgi:hypothetical protein
MPVSFEPAFFVKYWNDGWKSASSQNQLSERLELFRRFQTKFLTQNGKRKTIKL